MKVFRDFESALEQDAVGEHYITKIAFFKQSRRSEREFELRETTLTFEEFKVRNIWTEGHSRFLTNRYENQNQRVV